MNLIDILFPKHCLGCGKYGQYICCRCLGNVDKTKPVCIECERPAIDAVTHPRCIKRNSLNGSVAVWKYEGVIRKALISLKYHFAFTVANDLAENTIEYLRQNFTILPKAAILVPVPLHAARKRWRGFNQSEEMGKLIALKMGWQYRPDLVLRIKKTSPQVNLPEKDRLKNLQGIFAINPFHHSLITDHRPLIIFDDVWTTGTTLKEVGKVLKGAGAGEVWGLTIAR